MVYWDAELEKRVWKRVRGEVPDNPDLSELIRLFWAQSTDLRHLDRELYLQESRTLELLRELHFLCGGRTIPGPKDLGGSRGQRIQRCCQRCRQMVQLLTALQTHERYGPVFGDITRQQQAKCARLEQMRRNSGV